jgi:hypothetical protein
MELLERYIQEITGDLHIDEMNIKDAQMRLPGRRHFWVARMINHKIELERLRTKRDKLRKQMMQQLADNAPVKMSVPNLERSVDSTDDMQDLQLKIRENELIIELLEKTERNFTSCTYDISNIIKIIQLEQQ